MIGHHWLEQHVHGPHVVLCDLPCDMSVVGNADGEIGFYHTSRVKAPGFQHDSSLRVVPTDRYDFLSVPVMEHVTWSPEIVRFSLVARPNTHKRIRAESKAKRKLLRAQWRRACEKAMRRYERHVANVTPPPPRSFHYRIEHIPLQPYGISNGHGIYRFRLGYLASEKIWAVGPWMFWPEYTSDMPFRFGPGVLHDRAFSAVDIMT